MASSTPGMFTGRRKYIPLVLPGFLIGLYLVLAGQSFGLVIGLALMAYSGVLAAKYWNNPEQSDREWTGRDQFGQKRWHRVAIGLVIVLVAWFATAIVFAEIS
jgi:hypothetical protein